MMYGFLKLPASASLSERRGYRRYMCTLCDSLHKNYGIRGRLFVNYDSTTLALLIGGLGESLEEEVMSGSQEGTQLCLFGRKNPPEVFEFVSAVSIMLGYAKLLDKAIENGKKASKWVTKLSNKASDELAPYGLNKAFFEGKLQEQHRLEKEGRSIGTLSAPTSEIVSGILGAVAELTDKPEYSAILRELGFELGKMIYVQDGLLDYRKDLKTGRFNCIHACYFREVEKVDIERVSNEVCDFLKAARDNIASLLDEMELKNGSLLKKIFLRSLVKEGAGRGICSRGDECLNKAIYSVLVGGLTFQNISMSKEPTCDDCCGRGKCLCCCWVPCCKFFWQDFIVGELYHDYGLWEVIGFLCGCPFCVGVCILGGTIGKDCACCGACQGEEGTPVRSAKKGICD